jgi:hypothetical protein
VSRTLILALLVSRLAAAEAAPRQVKLAASLFGETVGEVQLTLVEKASTRLTYRSTVRVVRDSQRFRQQALIDVTFDSTTGQLIHSVARRCTAPDDDSAPPTCGEARELSKLAAVPALAAELFLSRKADGAEHCIDVIDEESATTGRACATAKAGAGGIELSGNKLGEAFRARVSEGLLVSLELPRQGALFTRATGQIELSDDDLFAEPIPASGDATAGVHHGLLKLRIFGAPEALAGLQAVSAPGQSALVGDDGASLLVEVRRVAMPKGKRSRAVLDKVAFLVAQGRGGHLDCQAATAWLLAQAKSRGWHVQSVEGFAFVDGRFAFHQWAIVNTPDGPVPVDPLLAQVPADAGHVQLATMGESAGSLLMTFRRGLSVAVQ